MTGEAEAEPEQENSAADEAVHTTEALTQPSSTAAELPETTPTTVAGSTEANLTAIPSPPAAATSPPDIVLTEAAVTPPVASEPVAHSTHTASGGEGVAASSATAPVTAQDMAAHTLGSASPLPGSQRRQARSEGCSAAEPATPPSPALSVRSRVPLNDVSVLYVCFESVWGVGLPPFCR